MSQGVLSLLSTLFLGACSVVGIREGTEQPRYSVVQTVGRVEIRQYGPRLAAETEIDADEMQSRREGFERVAAYIFGKNRADASIAMTAPVAQASGGSRDIAMTAPVSQSRDAAGHWTVRFFMPAKYTEATLPRPLDPRVVIVTVPAETMAVYRYSGSTGPEAVARARRELLAGLEGSGWAPQQSEPVAWFYDPPWTIPPLRRNEVAVPVARP